MPVKKCLWSSSGVRGLGWVESRAEEGGGGFGNERTQSERGEAAVGGLRAKLESV